MRKVFVLVACIFPYVLNAQIADSAKREVKLQGAINFRDVGGYITKEGKHVKWGKIYRSAAINKLTEQDLQKLQSLHLAYILDFRGPYEVQAAPDKIPAGAIRISLPAGSENIGDSNYMKTMVKSMRNDSALLQFYSVLTPFPARYTPLFDELLQANPDSALLFHCSAGKDRTGIAAALILYALGVDEQTIMQDYLATNYYRRTENERSIKGMMQAYNMDETTAKGMMAAKPLYLQATFQSIEKQYGSVDHYLETELGLTPSKRKALQKKFTE
ncbi:protein tyrosine/serine phosphatase [Russula earlei]|uniref:Protein tyrosine/serine phosphatase n=1 Tax=Russula earlei TaxID=71964 RepID=A0ACC0TVV8_9AGAM|nr:protein tyrosine/serine phosphatase [Russula earlei]